MRMLVAGQLEIATTNCGSRHSVPLLASLSLQARACADGLESTLDARKTRLFRLSIARQECGQHIPGVSLVRTFSNA